jgi:Bacterial regulatory proteins, gntR family
MTIPDDNLSAAESELFKAVPREATLGNRVTGQIEALIVEGRLQPGQHLPSERELADRFGVSRTWCARPCGFTWSIPRK